MLQREKKQGSGKGNVGGRVVTLNSEYVKLHGEGNLKKVKTLAKQKSGIRVF